jgi:hypothetical protein
MYEQPWFLQINLKSVKQQISILELLFDPKKEASRWKVGLTKLLHYKSTQLIVQLSHKGKILLNRLVVDYFPRFSKYYNFCCP